ncbi:MAG TPA: hypothetical protein VGL06_18055 [Pseudonocardiaceae bacterium]
MLTDVENALVSHVTRGDVLDLAGAEVIDEAAMRSWGESRTVRASVLRDIMRGRLAPDPDPHGLRLRGARIDGRLDLENITSTVALKLTDCLLDEGMNARDAHLAFVSLNGCRLEHPDEPALEAARLVAVRLDLQRAVLTARDKTGALIANRAHFGVLDCKGASLRNDSGPALSADGLRVDQTLFLDGEFTAVGAGEIGAISLVGAFLGWLDCTGASLSNDSGPALSADGLRVDQAAFLRTEFTVVGAGDAGAIRLVGAHVGDLDFTGASLRNESGPALGAYNLRVDRNMFLAGGFSAVAAGEVVVNLGNVGVGGSLVFRPARLEHRTNPRSLLRVDGLVYTGLPLRISTREWLRLLREATPEYAAQPYQQFAAAHRAAGHDAEVRRILMAQRRDQIDRRALTGQAERGWARLTGLLLGYGYQPWRALVCLLIALVAAVGLALVLGGQGGLVHPQSAIGCTAVERVGVGLDLGTPLVKTNAGAHCVTTATTPGQILTVAGWALQLLAWAFATLFIAGFTGVVRKT